MYEKCERRALLKIDSATTDALSGDIATDLYDVLIVLRDELRQFPVEPSWSCRGCDLAAVCPDRRADVRSIAPSPFRRTPTVR